jgi:predicted aspartyl protease
VQKLFSVCVLGLASIFGWTFSAFAAEMALGEEVVPFQLQRGHLIVVKCSVGGIQNLTAIIDTGVSETVIDMTLVRRLSLPAKAESAIFISQQATVWEVAIPHVQVGPIAVDRLEGIATDLSTLTAKLGIRPQVLIGMDLLHRSNLVIDYQNRRLSFGSAPILSHSTPLVSWVSGPSWRFAMIESTIGGRQVRLQVDSGFDGLLLYRERMPGLFRDDRSGGAALAPSESHIADVGQNVFVRSVDSRSVRIGDWQAPHSQFLVAGPPPGSAPFDGLIGTAFLSQRRVAFDFQNGMMYWE